MKHLLFCLLVSFSSSLLAAECVVVSGAKNDDNGAFKNRKLLNPQTSMVGGKKCIVVDGLQKLKNLVAANTFKGPELLVVFGAHGSKADDGTVKFHFNADEPTADEVYSYLRKLSARYQVGAVLHACQSGEVMNKLIKEDNDPLADKLCLLTSSSRGRMSFSNEKDLMSLLEKVDKPNSGKNLEKIFLETPSGMISSAAWEETGVSKYLRSKDLTLSVDLGFKAMNEMDKILRSPGAICDTPGETNSALCVASGISDKTYKDLMHFSDPYIPNKDKGNLLSSYTIMASLGEGNMQVCLSGLADFYKSRAETLETWGDLEKALADIKNNTKLYAACEAFRKETPDENMKKTLYAGDMQTGLDAYKASRVRLQKIYTKTDWSTFDLNTFAKDAAGDKKVCSASDKKETIQSLFGDNFFQEEYHSDENGNFNGPSEIAPMRNINTQHMMKSFQNASVDKPDMPNVIDAKRRKACANFKL